MILDPTSPESSNDVKSESYMCIHYICGFILISNAFLFDDLTLHIGLIINFLLFQLWVIQINYICILYILVEWNLFFQKLIFSFCSNILHNDPFIDHRTLSLTDFHPWDCWTNNHSVVITFSYCYLLVGLFVLFLQRQWQFSR